MKEYATDAVVLGLYPRGEADRSADLFTKELGRIDARAIGARKTLSKFSPHLTPGNLVRARLVSKKSYTLTDVMTDASAARPKGHLHPEVLSSLFLVRTLVPAENPDIRLWHALVEMLTKGRGDERSFLSLLGYNPRHAQCEACRNSEIAYFHISDQRFLCAVCSVKFPENEIHYIPLRN